MPSHILKPDVLDHHLVRAAWLCEVSRDLEVEISGIMASPNPEDWQNLRSPS